MIELQNLAVSYGDFTAVKNLNITIQDGEFFNFLGPSGCGKTTTLRCISGFETPSSGKVMAYGKDISGLLPEERNLGFVFQSYALFPSMSVYENIAFGLKAHKTDKKLIPAKIQTVAEKTGITEHLNKKISDLSGGQQQRVAIARALVLEPKILLMDEPLSNLDAKLRVSMREEIKRLQKEIGITTIYVTHDQEEALAISDRIAVFNLGTIEQIGTPKEIYGTPQTEFVAKFIGDINCFSGEANEQIHKQMDVPANSRLYIRPQKLKVSKNGLPSDAFALPAEIAGFEYLGCYSKIRLKTDENHTVISLVFDADRDFSLGDKVQLSFQTDDLLIFGGADDE